ncbi:hypothetical protein ACGFY7_23910 [Streptomyces prunicolor]
MVGPPVAEVRVLDGEFADEFGQGGVDVNPDDFYIGPTPPITDKRLRRR